MTARGEVLRTLAEQSLRGHVQASVAAAAATQKITVLEFMRARILTSVPETEDDEAFSETPPADSNVSGRGRGR
jgi:hypothetical protein